MAAISAFKSLMVSSNLAMHALSLATSAVYFLTAAASLANSLAYSASIDSAKCVKRAVSFSKRSVSAWTPDAAS